MNYFLFAKSGMMTSKPNPKAQPGPVTRFDVATPVIIVPRLLRIVDAAKYLSSTTWFVEELLRKSIVPSLLIGKRRVVDVRQLDIFIDQQNEQARKEQQKQATELRVVA